MGLLRWGRGEAGLVWEAGFPACQGVSASAFFGPMKGFALWPGVEVVPVFPLALPVVPRLEKLSSRDSAPPPPPALYNLFVPTSLFGNQGGGRKTEKN